MKHWREIDTQGFCKEVNFMNSRINILPHAVDAVEGEINIAEKWKNNFKKRIKSLDDSNR